MITGLTQIPSKLQFPNPATPLFLGSGSWLRSALGPLSAPAAQSSPIGGCGPTPVVTCCASLAKLQDELEEWKWTSKESHQAVHLLREEGLKLREYLEVARQSLERWSDNQVDLGVVSGAVLSPHCYEEIHRCPSPTLELDGGKVCLA
jgi:hypothetical protein